MMGQLSTLATLFNRQEVPKSLELIENDQVRLKRLDASLRQRGAQRTDKVVTPLLERWRQLMAPTHLLKELAKLAADASRPNRSRELASNTAVDPLLQGWPQPLDLLQEPFRRGRRPLKNSQCRPSLPPVPIFGLLEQEVKHGSFGCLARTPSPIEGRARCECHQV